MKSGLCKLFISILILNIYCKCSGYNTNAKIEKKNFSATILLIEEQSQNMITWDPLFEIKDFLDIYQHSSDYIDSAIYFLKDSSFTLLQKKICILTMQRASIEEYIKICYACKDLFDKNKMDEELLRWTISPNFANRYLIVRNYENSMVSIFLKEIKDGNNTSTNLKAYIEEIISGTQWKKIKEIDGL